MDRANSSPLSTGLPRLYRSCRGPRHASAEGFFVRCGGVLSGFGGGFLGPLPLELVDLAFELAQSAEDRGLLGRFLLAVLHLVFRFEVTLAGFRRRRRSVPLPTSSSAFSRFSISPRRLTWRWRIAMRSASLLAAINWTFSRCARASMKRSSGDPAFFVIGPLGLDALAGRFQELAGATDRSHRASAHRR